MDDSTVSTPPGQGANVFKDRGAIDRADQGDFFTPTAELVTPLDNDADGLDSDPNTTVIRLPNGQYEYFSLLLSDEGTGVSPATVNASTVTLTQNGVQLRAGVDFVLGYNAGNYMLLLSPLSEIWEPDSVYVLKLDNTVIADLAGNKLRSNQPDGGTRFTIILGDLDLDFADAPNTIRPNSTYTRCCPVTARHVMLPDQPLTWGRASMPKRTDSRRRRPTETIWTPAATTKTASCSGWTWVAAGCCPACSM